MLHSDAYCHDSYGKLLHLRAKYGKSTVHSTEHSLMLSPLQKD